MGQHFEEIKWGTRNWPTVNNFTNSFWVIFNLKRALCILVYGEYTKQGKKPEEVTFLY
jgi:hypothetical protein